MSSQGSPTLELDVRRRRWERPIAATALVVVAAMPWLLGWRVSLWLPFAVSVLLPVAAGLHRAGWLGGRACLRRAVWRSDGRWLLVDGRGRSCEAQLRTDTRVGGAYVWLRWDADRTRSMLLVHGDLAAPELRRLIVRLRMESVAPAAAV